MRRLREAKLSAPVLRWLRGQGFHVWVEVPHYGSSVDVVARHPGTGEMVAVELKVSLSRGVIRQAIRCGVFAGRIYAAVSTRPSSKSLEQAAKLGVGVLSVVNGQVIVVRESDNATRNGPWAPHVERMVDRLAHMRRGGTAGKPMLSGIGPAKSCYRAVVEYRAGRPAATWAEIFRAVSNHYGSAKSMAQSLRKLDGWWERSGGVAGAAAPAAVKEVAHT